jgi:hypothetical protein
MRNMLAFFAALLLTFAGVGWYLGWYHFHTSPNADGRTSVTIDFDTKKIGKDLRDAEEAVQKKLAEQAARMEADKKAEASKKGEFKP